MKAGVGLFGALVALCVGAAMFVKAAVRGTPPDVALIDPAGAICSASNDQRNSGLRLAGPPDTSNRGKNR